MKAVKDNFSTQSKGYSQFRPVYPKALFDEVLSHVLDRGKCWDCATGNGQIANVMADHFKEVMASDISDGQLSNAVSKPNITYLNCRAEASPFANDTFDLITVGQAIHWFDFDAFNKEVIRVAKPNAILAVIGYGLMYVHADFDRELLAFYNGTIGRYWDLERKHIDEHYRSVPFPFESIPLQNEYSIDVNWNLAQLQGYLNTWSSVNRYIKKHGTNPVNAFIQSLRDKRIWSDEQQFEVRFPLFVLLGSVQK